MCCAVTGTAVHDTERTPRGQSRGQFQTGLAVVHYNAAIHKAEHLLSGVITTVCHAHVATESCCSLPTADTDGLEKKVTVATLQRVKVKSMVQHEAAAAEN